jgi:hypothetical protein
VYKVLLNDPEKTVSAGITIGTDEEVEFDT